MDFNLDRIRIDINCPRCEFAARPFLRQVKHCDVLVCGGCKGNIQLIDHLGTYRKSERRIRRAIEGLTSAFNQTINIRI